MGGKYCGEFYVIEFIGYCYGGYYCEFGVDKLDFINLVNGMLLLGNCFILGLYIGKIVSY